MRTVQITIACTKEREGGGGGGGRRTDRRTHKERETQRDR